MDKFNIQFPKLDIEIIDEELPAINHIIALIRSEETLDEIVEVVNEKGYEILFINRMVIYRKNEGLINTDKVVVVINHNDLKPIQEIYDISEYKLDNNYYPSNKPVIYIRCYDKLKSLPVFRSKLNEMMNDFINWGWITCKDYHFDIPLENRNGDGIVKHGANISFNELVPIDFIVYIKIILANSYWEEDKKVVCMWSNR